MILLDDFMLRAALAGLDVALAAAPLGCFVVWRRMAYFGDATAHAAILGVALALAFSTSVFVGALAVSLVMAMTVSALSGRGFAMDTLLGVLALGGLGASFRLDTPTGPTIVCLAALIFATTSLGGSMIRRQMR